MYINSLISVQVFNLKKIFTISQARENLTKLDKILRPGEVLEVRRRNKKYAKIELAPEREKWQEIWEAIQKLPEPGKELKDIAENYKKYLYQKR